MDEVAVRLHRERPIAPAQVLELYASVGWWPERTAEQVGRVLAAAPAVGAWEGDRLIGFGRLVSDGVFRAYVEDLVVLERYRGRGVGRALMARLMEEAQGIPVVSLFCKPKLVGFYQEGGFQPTNQVVLHRLVGGG